MAASDAGIYQARISSYNYEHESHDFIGSNSPDCDLLVLPLLESISLHSPVSFTVQEGPALVYDPASIISTQYTGDDSVSKMELSRATQLIDNLNLSPKTSHIWFRNGKYLSNEVMYNSTATTWERLSLQMASNDTADLGGNYVGILYTSKSEVNLVLQSMCWSYYHYIEEHTRFNYIPLKVSFWSIILSSSECPNQTVPLYYDSHC